MSLSHRTIPVFILTLFLFPEQLQRGRLSSLVVPHIPDSIPCSLGGEQEQVVEEQRFWKASTNSQLTWFINAQAPQGKGHGLGSSSRLYSQHPQVCFSNPFFTVIIYY